MLRMSPLTLTRIARGFVTAAMTSQLNKEASQGIQGRRTALAERLELGHDDLGLLVETGAERREEVGAVEEVHREIGAGVVKYVSRCRIDSARIGMLTSSTR